MKKITRKISLLTLAGVIFSFSCKTTMNKESVYNVKKLNQPMNIDANWDKAEWKNIVPVSISNFMGEIPAFKPEAQAKMMYDDNNLYLIFRVKDKFVRCITNKINGPVWEDGAVEFFFAPDPAKPLVYFNLEINCGGTPLMHYNLIARKESADLAEDDIKLIEIAHSMPELIDPEMKDPVTWTLEYRIPLAMLEKYMSFPGPSSGVEWKANFYKIAENSSNPHYITWSVIDIDKPDFHRPEFFGKLLFD